MIKRLLLIGLVLVVGIQFIPIDRTNPPVTGEIPASAAIASILKRSCYDCHSNETEWPWYSRVAPVAFLIARDVHEGRRHLNFSTWTQYSQARQAKAVKEIGEQVAKGEMPMGIYLPMHPHARLSDADKAAIDAWVKSSAAAPAP